jgi:hypothetical protein
MTLLEQSYFQHLGILSITSSTLFNTSNGRSNQRPGAFLDNQYD